MSDIRAAIDKIEEMALARQSGRVLEASVRGADRWFMLNAKGDPCEVPPPAEPLPQTLGLTTLSALASYVRENRDHVDLSRATVLVTHLNAALIGPAHGERLQRATWALAHHDEATRHNFTEGESGDWMAPEQAVLYLQHGFAPSPDRDVLLRLLGSVRDEASVTAEDDGVTQQVTARSGVVLSAQVKIPSPVILRPYQTFREIEQPAVAFVVRARRKAGELPGFSLTPVAHGWRIDAAKSIAALLREKLSDVPVPILY
jgi:hypothetical protein